MPNEGTNSGAPANGSGRRRCSRCGEDKPHSAFYYNPATVCKQCQNRASQFSNACRRAAIAHLIATYRTEYQALLVAERTKPGNLGRVGSGGDSDGA
jgi:uncharacterized protein (DUF983 family)